MHHNETIDTPIRHFEQPLRLRVRRRDVQGGDVAVLDLEHADGAELPAWKPGAHIALRLGADDRVREYSLCGSPSERTSWRIAVRHDAAGRGGSAYVHEVLVDGAPVDVVRLANLFPFAPDARPCFIAGGIGITPMLPMIEAAADAGADWNLLYLGRTRESMPFLEALQDFGDRVCVVESSRDGRADLASFLAGHGNAHVYSCGPESLLEEVENVARALPGIRLSVERFRPRDVSEYAEERAFEVIVDSTGQRVPVRPGQSTLDALLDVGVRVMNSCGEGTCGSCETAVLDGVPDHRDSILTDEEREEGEYMYVCVSRSLTPTLTLDL